jgi:hypothetical protein
VPLVKWQCKFETSIELSRFTGPLLSMRDAVRAGERIAVIVCGGNADLSRLA